jgi:hypothetical protein
MTAPLVPDVWVPAFPDVSGATKGRSQDRTAEGPEQTPRPLLIWRRQFAAWYASMTDFEMRPRSFTLCPFARAHSRIAAVSSRLERLDFSATAV